MRLGFAGRSSLIGFQVGEPYSPVTGPRLLVDRSGDASVLRALLIATIRGEARRLGLSSAHLNFAAAADVDAFEDDAWLPRFDWQFHWRNQGWRDFVGGQLQRRGAELGIGDQQHSGHRVAVLAPSRHRAC